MGKLQSMIWKAVVIGSFAIGASPAGAVGSPSVHPSASVQAVLVSKYEVQQRLEEAVQAHQSTVKFKYDGSVKNFEALLDDALLTALDHTPYMRYIIDRYHYAWRGSSSSVNVTVTFTYRESPEQTAYVDRRVQEITGQILQPGMNEHEQVKVIHDWIVYHFKYDQQLRNYTAYSGLVTGEAVCQGYTLLAYKLLTAAGIQSLIVEGTAGGEPHAWNLVNLGGSWYHLDTTWDDPLGGGEHDVSYDYYLLSDKEMKKDHAWTKSYPAAGQTYRTALNELKLADPDPAKQLVYKDLEQELNYTLYDAAETVSDHSGLLAKAREAIQAGKTSAVIRYSGQESELVNALGNLYGLNISHITYLAQPLEGTEDLKVKIEWQAGP